MTDVKIFKTLTSRSKAFLEKSNIVFKFLFKQFKHNPTTLHCILELLKNLNQEANILGTEVGFDLQTTHFYVNLKKSKVKSV